MTNYELIDNWKLLIKDNIVDLVQIGSKSDLVQIDSKIEPSSTLLCVCKIGSLKKKIVEY